MPRKKKALTDPVRPSKEVLAAAKALLGPMVDQVILNAVTRQVELMTQQLDDMNATLEKLVAVVKERAEPSVITEPAPTPNERKGKLLVEPAPAPPGASLTEST